MTNKTPAGTPKNAPPVTPDQATPTEENKPKEDVPTLQQTPRPFQSEHDNSTGASSAYLFASNLPPYRLERSPPPPEPLGPHGLMAEYNDGDNESSYTADSTEAVYAPSSLSSSVFGEGDMLPGSEHKPDRRPALRSLHVNSTSDPELRSVSRRAVRPQFRSAKQALTSRRENPAAPRAPSCTGWIPVRDELARSGALFPGPRLPFPVFSLLPSPPPSPPTPSVQDGEDKEVNTDDKGANEDNRIETDDEIDDKVPDDGNHANNGGDGSTQDKETRRESTRRRSRALTMEEGEVLKKARSVIPDED
ncbi:hypothetical protein QBC47DRAFT_457693 [Echria macrotheca]|uniref:Uncharacterized protein n=1 Tax=Echria macrotheca TaxID=438768 RepID=A0AAJ0BM71_9PEZI|nr:hypothetical protein QBC47DRAFT_457693 [Echria macrotheca]